MTSSIYYRIVAAQPAAHLFAVTLNVDKPAANGQLLRLPAWIPGSYMIRDFARHLVTLSAHSGERALSVTKLDKHSWQVEPCAGPLVLNYQVYAFDLSVRGAYLDHERGFFNASSLCLAVVGQESQPHHLEVSAPESASGNWKLASALPALAVDQAGFGCYQADNYDALIDHPFEMGCFEEVCFTACGVPHRFILSGRHHHADLARLARDTQQICEYQIRLFGTPAPFADYLFMLFVGSDVYGGLEHRNSTALMAGRDDLPLLGDDSLSDGYVQLLGLISHEYFHNWNVKRIKPAAFTPYDLTRENYTRLLWAFEGVTSYYDDLTLVRCGLIDKKRYLGGLAKTVTAVARGSGRLKQTLEASSFDAWTKFYRQDENSPNAIVSYYAKGALVALALDLLIRRDTAGRCSLDDVMRALWGRHQQDGQGVGETEWEALASEVSGLDLKQFFDLALRSTAELPLAELLADAGIALMLTPSASASDRGEVVETMPDSSLRAVLGVKSVSDPLGVRLQQVWDGGAAQAAGLSAGDVLLALDGLKVSDLDKALSRYRPGDKVSIHAFRRDELMEFELALQGGVADTCRLLLQNDGGSWLE
ncbi:PDZ domain-containing protein [Craterilacuibacter sp. RT1T]|uniref:M61 family metallopeptidase n=1 Tax=Craterilacuibacter sp. RT1T TaxID=2942211 RepID=UPI0020C0763A|nr:PDZ domain-containing protein [Craterilacuibacter sp. RT1T]MCL6263786.1 PDZ domain-containing protein [Craterilacuibacter sp. RT1T]